MSALAELIDREFLAARAPRPVTYLSGDLEMDLALNRWEDNVSWVLPNWVGGAARFRMSDGSLLIVRRKR